MSVRALWIRVGKECITKSGLIARIYATDGKGDFSVHGAVFNEGWVFAVWTGQGRALFMPGDHDLLGPWTGNTGPLVS